MTNKIRSWYCKQCKQVLARSAFPRYFDANTPCTACQSGNSNTPDSTDAAAGQEQSVYVHRRGLVRRHSRDNRDE